MITNWPLVFFTVFSQLGAGLAFARFYVGLAYEWGFLNLCEAGAWDEGASLRTRNLRISVGYNF